MAALYITAGVFHFLRPRLYVKMMPPYVPAHQLMVLLSGIAEVVLGFGLLWSATRSLAAWGLIVLLIAIFPANIYMATSGRFAKVPAWLLWARLPLQGIFIWCAWQFT